MNTAPPVTERADGYVQDLASQWVAEAVGAQPGERVADVCAAPGGKAMVLAATGATVVAADIRKARVGLIRSNAPAAPACSPPTPPALRSARVAFDRVLIDAPCSGLGTLRRRPDARWRIDADAPERLAAVQRAMVDAAVDLLQPGGMLVYSVCTLTNVEGPRSASTSSTTRRRARARSTPPRRPMGADRAPRPPPPPARQRHRRHVPPPGHGAWVGRFPWGPVGEDSWGPQRRDGR